MPVSLKNYHPSNTAMVLVIARLQEGFGHVPANALAKNMGHCAETICSANLGWHGITYGALFGVIDDLLGEKLIALDNQTLLVLMCEALRRARYPHSYAAKKPFSEWPAGHQNAYMLQAKAVLDMLNSLPKIGDE